MTICSDSSCYGCAACADICPRDAIEMTDESGFWRPVIDGNKCINCKICREVCPALNAKEVLKDRIEVQCYAAWSADKTRHFESASGGVASELSETVITGGGFVAGVLYEQNSGIVKHAVIDRVDQVELISKSKYVLSSKRGIYKDVLERIKMGQNGLFFGTPCEVNAMRRYLRIKSPKLESKLKTVDLLCRGGNSSRCLREHLNYVSRNKKITNITFRGGKYDCKLTVYKNKKIVYQGYQYLDAYFKYFMHHSLLQERCYTCPFANRYREGDITLGDFWGINASIANVNPINGMNMVMINSQSGKELLQLVKDKIICYERDIDEAVHGNDTLKEPTEKPPEYEKVWSIIPEKGFGEVLKIVYEESEFELYWKNRYLYFKHKVKEMSVMIIHLIEKIVRGGGRE